MFNLHHLKKIVFFIIFISISTPAQVIWEVKETENFKIVYRSTHSDYSDYILNCAESSLKKLNEIFAYTPDTKIVINTYDINDYGFASATSVPENFIRMELEPFEPAYENLLYNERIKWVLNHELVHIAVNDNVTGIEKAFRTIFSKTAPEQLQPLTVFYSLITNYNRFTPRWHQEAVAVLLETWLNGGFGRNLGNFDEMYFRAMTAEGKEFPNELKLDAIESHNNFLLETLFYLYGGRFALHLALNYDIQKLIEWYKPYEKCFLASFKSRFEEIYETDFETAWSKFLTDEKDWQKKNIQKLSQVEITKPDTLVSETQGWVTLPYYDASLNKVFYGAHKPHHLAALFSLDLTTKEIDEIGTLTTPSIQQVASTAYDSTNKLLFYTSNNNQLYRDVYVTDVTTGSHKILFEDARIGQLAVSAGNHLLWGVMHSTGIASLVCSPYPYNTVNKVHEYKFGEEIHNLSVSASGEFLSTVIHNSDGSQKIVLYKTQSILNGDFTDTLVLYDKGSPDNVHFDGRFIYWNAYTNGVSNIFRSNLDDFKIELLTNTISGFFKPVVLNDSTYFAFEFTTEGFLPVVLKKEVVEKLYSINYLGDKTVLKEKNVVDYYVKNEDDAKISENYEYNSLSEISFRTFIPVITGFQGQKALGLFTRLTDPLLNNDILIEFAYSPFKENPAGPKFHFRLKYELLKKYEFGLEHNAADFYDLVNKRKRGMIGTKIRFGHTHYWIYDNPLKVTQKSEIALYTGIKFINDNLVKVSEPDFMVAQTIYNYKELRRTIGSSDFEHGNDYSLTLMVFGSDPKNPQFAGEMHVEASRYSLFLADHNVLHLKLSAGYHYKNDNLYQAHFFFGGFGNRELENTDVKQFRGVFRMPGLPIYSIAADRFVKLLIENDFPPIRFSNIGLGNHYLSHIDIELFSNILLAKTDKNELFTGAGGQINFLFKHWYNLESTISAGIAWAWFGKEKDTEYFFSLKLLRN